MRPEAKKLLEENIGSITNMCFDLPPQARETKDTVNRLDQFKLMASLVAQAVKNPPAMQETQIRSLSWENPLEKGMAVHSHILAQRIP